MPVALEPEEAARVELMEPAAMAVPAAPVAGPLAVTVGEAMAHDGLGHRRRTGRGRSVVVGVTAVGGVPPEVADGRRREAGRRSCRWRCRVDRGRAHRVPRLVQVVGAVV